ncbi:MAG: hypothetical protein H0W48_00380 [Methylibium sp.]|nr:hypothetical protein [Methylibium sp.]
MANAIYGKGREAFGNAGINWGADTIKAILVDTALYTVSIDVHQFISDVPAGSRVGTAVTLGTKTNTLGVFDAADSSFTALSAAPTIEAVVIYKDTGVEGTSALIAYIDTATGLPMAAGATQVDVTWDNGANKIFKL